MISYISAIVAGLLTHLGAQYYEPTALQAVCWGTLANTVLGLRFWLLYTQSIVPFLLLLNAIYLITLYTSIFIYRTFFHRLRAFPGPFWARVSKLWTCEIHLRGDYHRETVRLHQKYGDIVRVAPNELDINDVEAIKLIYGSGSKLYKGPWYDGPSATGEARSIQGTKDHGKHRLRRKTWAQGNSGAAMIEFEPLMVQHLNVFIEQIRARKEVDIAHWYNFLSFDIMGDLTFGVPFDMVKTGQTHHFMDTIHKFMKAVSILSAIPWLNSLANALPTDSAVKDLEKFSRDCFQNRKAKGSSRKDLFYYLLGEDQDGTKLTELELIMDSRTAIVGGSDTTSIALGCLIYYLVAHQDKYKRLQAEVLAQGEQMDNNSLGNLPYLGAVINEALRLMPPVPQGLQRVVPPEGMQLAGKFIPGNTLVSVSPWTVQRDPRNWGRPDEFIPERWLGEGPEPCIKDAWIPFSIGAYGCVGKPLAMMELRVITATVVKNFDISFAKGFDAAAFEASVTNDFTMTPPRVEVVLSPR
ncbi:uncharacterized protein A1O5_12179 [Cladophialophora psammophila CBS 110553]|uniref:Cytochrome P450 oxidoreductase n=1 Tax=Cladophialophora psammophila CBS 110553 TaxID=1182543 RepID=W9VUN3_9EURO|nr:uncharacterized protein A1O5_12179 [Cladophialophora psammophila CBS 110553]EXJ59298.1 hypothetical protein A1O5_12179 [Cladophialophora psammophila CBS 110553]